MRTTIVHALGELASLHTHPPLACGLRSISMTRSTMSWQGQAEQPMMLRGRSMSSMVPDAPVPWPWTRAAGRVWFAAGRLGSMRSRTSAQLCSMLPGGHSGMAVWPFQVQCSMIPTLVDRRRHLCGRVQAVGAISGRRRHLEFSAYLARSRGGASAPPLHPSHAQNGKSRAPKTKCGHQKASTALERPHRHAPVPTRPACRTAAQRCESASTRTAQLQTTPCPPPSSKAKVLERPEPWKTRPDRAASSAARLGPASPSSTLSWKPI